MKNERPQFEVISTEERSRRDPRGRNRVTLLGDSVIIRTDQFPPAPEVEIGSQDEQASEIIEPGEAHNG
jgi:hypothetical protein